MAGFTKVDLFCGQIAARRGSDEQCLQGMGSELHKHMRTCRTLLRIFHDASADFSQVKQVPESPQAILPRFLIVLCLSTLYKSVEPDLYTDAIQELMKQ